MMTGVPARPVLYVDPQSPYAWFALARAPRVLGVEPEVVPITLGKLFAVRGSGSWARTGRRAAGIAECDARAARYGLPAIAWRDDWPQPSLVPARATAWAALRGATVPFLHAQFASLFVAGEDPTDMAVLARIAERAGLDGDEVGAGVVAQETKDALRAWTDRAVDKVGVPGIPTTAVGDALFFGDDRLEAAAAAISAA